MLLMFLLGCDVLVRYRLQWRAAPQIAAGAAA